MLTKPEEEFGASRRFQWAWTALILVLTVAPYLANFRTTPKGETYTWILPPYPADAYAYRAWARQAYDGRWLFSLKFTALPHRPFLFLPFFLAAGKTARLTRLDVGLVFLALKSAGVLFFFWAFFGFLRQLKLTRLQSTAAAAMAGISAGLGGFTPLVFPEGLSRAWTPVDIWLVDANTFWSLLWNPVFPFSLALMVLAIRWTEESLDANDPRRAWKAAPCLTALALLHPYPLAVLYPLLTALCVIRRPKDWLSFWSRAVGASLPVALFIAGLSFFHPLIRAHNGLGTEERLSLFSYAVGFAPPLALIAAALFLKGREFPRRYWPLFLWFGVSLVLTYCPVWFRTKYIFGAHLPLCLLAGAAAEPILAALPWRRSWTAALAAALLALASYSQVFNLRESLAEVAANEEGQFRLRDGMTAGLQYLASHGAPSDLVFAAAPTSAKICAFSGKTVFWGHWAQSVDSKDRRAWMKNVFTKDSDWSPEERRRRFWDSGVAYLFLDGNWREGFGKGIGPRLLADADKVFENPEVTIYRRSARADGTASSALKVPSQDVKAATSFGSPISRR
jgi:hypothetical protein